MAKMKQGCGWLGGMAALSGCRKGAFGPLSLACALAAMWMAPGRAQTASEIVLHNFGSPPTGANPSTGVIRDSAGNLYGTTQTGGTAGAGVVYRVDPAGHYTVLYNFTGGADGGRPMAGVIGDSAGNLYGTTEQGGGASGCGVVFKLDKTGQLTVLYSFTDWAHGCNSTAGVFRDSAGNLYGTAANAVYKLDTAGQESVLYNFGDCSNAYGCGPLSGVIRDSAGNLYGTTQEGGGPGYGYGVVYKLDTAGQVTVLYNFNSCGSPNGGCANGGSPRVGVIRDSAGNLYGTTSLGGTYAYGIGPGVLYKLDTAGNYTVLCDLSGDNSGVVSDPAGNLYGTTANAVYKVDTAGQLTWLYGFTGGVDGSGPNGVIRDSAGNLYGNTANGGAGGAGVVYKLDAAGQETVLYSFMPGPGGTHPWAGVIGDSAGNLYGTTTGGGSADMGVVYKLDAAGKETVLYSLTGFPGNGGVSNAGVIRDSAGNLYGTSNLGGPEGYGEVFEVNAAGQETMLYGFTGGTDGKWPMGGVIRDSAGNLYGTTQYGGAAGYGAVFKLDATGQETVLYAFTGGADGGQPLAGVIRDSAGNLYGTTQTGGTGSAGVVFKVDTSGQETVLYNFTGGADGGFAPLYPPGPHISPSAGVIRDSAGNLYGTTPYGGVVEVPGGCGVVYKLDAAGNETVLHTFTCGADGANPQAGVILGPAGNLFGTTTSGGKNGGGVVYVLKGAAAAQ